jgi:hypothetical protein
MDSNVKHSVLIEVRCEITAKIFRIERNRFPKSNSARFVQVIVQTAYEQARTITYNQPFEIDSENFLYLVLIRHNDDDDQVWRTANVNLVRKNWGLMFVNQTGCDLVVDIYPQTESDDGKQTRTWNAPCIGIVHTQKFVFGSFIED